MAGRRLYVAVGDSLTTGYGAKPDQSFVRRLHQAIGNGREEETELVNAGVNGATAAEILRMLETDRGLRESIHEAEVISLTAGGNDLLQAAKDYLIGGNPVSLRQALKAFQEHYDGLVGTFRRLKGNTPSRYRLLLIGLYNPVPELPESAIWVQAFNRQMEKHAGDHIHFIDVYDIFCGREKELLYEDFVHPNEEGYRLIAEQALRSERQFI